MKTLKRLEKALFFLLFIPLFDLISTLFSLSFGGQEVGIIGKLIYDMFGERGLEKWVTILSVLLIVVPLL